MGSGWSFCWWVTVVVCGCWSLFMGAGSLSMGTGLFMGAWITLVGSGVGHPGRCPTPSTGVQGPT